MNESKKDLNIILPEFGEEEVVILSQDYLFNGIKNEDVDDMVSNISSNKVNFNEMNHSKAIKIKSIIEITSNQNSRSIDVTYTYNGEEHYEAIMMKNKKDRDKLLQSVYEYMKEEFDMSSRKGSRIGGVALPVLFAIITLIAGRFLVWMAQLAEEGVKRTTIVKSSVYYMYYTLRFLGVGGVKAIAGVIILGCLLFVIKRLVVPPTMDVIARREAA